MFVLCVDERSGIHMMCVFDESFSELIYIYIYIEECRLPSSTSMCSFYVFDERLGRHMMCLFDESFSEPIYRVWKAKKFFSFF